MVNSSIGCAGKFENLTLKTVYRVSSSGIFNGTSKFRYKKLNLVKKMLCYRNNFAYSFIGIAAELNQP